MQRKLAYAVNNNILKRKAEEFTGIPLQYYPADEPPKKEESGQA